MWQLCELLYTCHLLTYLLPRVHTPNGVSVSLAVLAGITVETNRQTDRQTDRHTHTHTRATYVTIGASYAMHKNHTNQQTGEKIHLLSADEGMLSIGGVKRAVCLSVCLFVTSVATYARCGGIFNNDFTANLPKNLPVSVCLFVPCMPAIQIDG